MGVFSPIIVPNFYFWKMSGVNAGDLSAHSAI
jgi:hypothetical protein